VNDGSALVHIFDDHAARPEGAWRRSVEREEHSILVTLDVNFESVDAVDPGVLDER
jgi:hypothetical protein